MFGALRSPRRIFVTGLIAVLPLLVTLWLLSLLFQALDGLVAPLIETLAHRRLPGLGLLLTLLAIFLVGLLLGASLTLLAGLMDEASLAFPFSLWTAGLAGLLVGAGTSIGGGCTSGGSTGTNTGGGGSGGSGGSSGTGVPSIYTPSAPQVQLPGSGGGGATGGAADTVNGTVNNVVVGVNNTLNGLLGK